MHPHKKRCHFAGTFTFQIYAYMFLKVFLFQNSFTLQNEDIKDQQGNTRMVKTDRVEKMSHETLADEATRFFGALKTKRTKTIQTKMADFVQKEDQLRKCIFFQNLQRKWWRGSQRESATLEFQTERCHPKGYDQ